MPTSVPNFNFPAPLVTEIKGVSQNLMWGLLAPTVPRTLKILCVRKVLGKIKQSAKFQHRISMDHAVMRICIFHKLSIIYINVKNFHGSLTTVVRAQNDMSKTADITDTIFD